MTSVLKSTILGGGPVTAAVIRYASSQTHNLQSLFKMEMASDTTIDSFDYLLATLEKIGFFHKYGEEHRADAVAVLKKRFVEEINGQNAEHFRRYPGELLVVDFYQTNDDFMLEMLELLASTSFGLFPAKDFKISFSDPCEFQFQLGQKTYSTEFDVDEVNWRILEFVTDVCKEVNDGVCPQPILHSAFDEGTYLIFCHEEAFLRLKESGLIPKTVDELHEANLPPWIYNTDAS